MFWTAVPKPNWVPIHLLWIGFSSSAQLPNVLSHKDSINNYIEIPAKKLTTVLVRKQVDYKLILTLIDLIARWREDAVLWRNYGFLKCSFLELFLKISIRKLFSKHIEIHGLIALNITSFYFIRNLCHCQRLTFFNVLYTSVKWLFLSCKWENLFAIQKYHSIPQMQYFPNSFWLTCWSPAWTHMMWSDSLYSFNFPFYFPRACIYISSWNMNVFLSHKLLLRNLGLNNGFGAICAIRCCLFSIATGPSHTELAIKQSVFLSVIHNKLIYSVNSLI